MKLYIIRHGEPNYEIDSLTEEGWREAEALADRLEKENIDTFYTSPLGRAKDTAKPLLTRLGREAEVLPFLREFNDHPIWRPDNTERRKIPWDWMPEDWTGREGFFLEKEWYKDPVMEEADVYGYYKETVEAFDALLARHGYVREGRIYKVERGSHEKVALFCHLGLECVLLSHLMNCSPMVLWHGLCPLPSSVTTIYTEERRKGSASFRCERIGDLSHLYAAGLEPSFAARFCECYEDDTRH